ncbi:MAG TPA: amidase family protein, partial [Bryobacteraceae bacterium]|nr:amidase family protein [Bryobacteraceae bacterium]
MSTKTPLPLGRRQLMKLVATVAALPGLRAQTSTPPATIPTPQPQGGRGEQVPQRVSKNMVIDALAVMGLYFTDPQLDMLLPVVNRTLASYETVRKIDVPLDTAPAISFSPLLPGFKLPKGSAVYRPPRAPALLKFKNPAELAFLPAVQLGALIRAKRITSLALTQMYLQRLKTYGPKLNCVITLTEDLALDQAKQADASLRRGRVLSPLHGVPFGAKDLFDTKGILT